MELISVAERDDRIVVTGDPDFAALLAHARRRSPSLILFRTRNTPRADDQAALLLGHLDDLAEDLERGAVSPDAKGSRFSRR